MLCIELLPRSCESYGTAYKVPQICVQLLVLRHRRRIYFLSSFKVDVAFRKLGLLDLIFRRWSIEDIRRYRCNTHAICNHCTPLVAPFWLCTWVEWCPLLLAVVHRHFCQCNKGGVRCGGSDQSATMERMGHAGSDTVARWPTDAHYRVFQPRSQRRARTLSAPSTFVVR